MRVSFSSEPEAVVMSFMFTVPGLEDQTLEATRIMTSKSHAKQIVEVLCRGLKYYPTEEKGSEA